MGEKLGESFWTGKLSVWIAREDRDGRTSKSYRQQSRMGRGPGLADWQQVRRTGECGGVRSVRIARIRGDLA